MFDIVSKYRKRRVWSPTTVAVSIAAHVLLFGAAAGLSTREAPAAPTEEDPPIWIETDPPAPVEVRPEPPAPPAPEQPEPDEPVPAVEGRTLEVPQVTEVPTRLPPVNPNEEVTDPRQYTGEGPIGNRYNENATGNPGTPVPPAPPTETGNEPYAAEVVTVLPQIRNRSEVERVLRNNYPPILRDAGVAGRVTVTMIIDEEGKVEPGSVSVVSATNDGFRDASVRAAERFRFRPAQLDGRPVSVIVAVPIEWKLEY